MKAYDPYRNMDTKKLGNNEYPHLLVLSGMNDPRVAYFEPLRWIAKMRKLKADSQKGSVRPQENEERLIMLQIDDAGHAGSSGVFSHFETLAFEYAFLITKLGAPMKQFHIVGATEAKYSVFETLSTTTEPELKSKAKSIRAISPVKSGSRLLNHSKGRLKQWLNNLF